MSEYAHPYPVVRDFFEGNGWKTVCDQAGEGLVWVVRTEETIRNYHEEEAVLVRALDEGLFRDNTVLSDHRYADEYVIADRAEVKPNGTLVFSLGGSQANVSVKAYASGYWKEFHLAADAEEIAKRTATMLREDD